MHETKYYCDRCGKECDVTELNQIILSVTSCGLPGQSDKKEINDICDDCVDKLRNFFKPLPRLVTDHANL